MIPAITSWRSKLRLEAKYPGSSEGLLLRGHALHSQHRFHEAEQVAQQLIKVRQAPFDYGLLGDVLMEQGRLRDAVGAYQKMLDLKPNLRPPDLGGLFLVVDEI